jgi:hypothetical protein
LYYARHTVMNAQIDLQRNNPVTGSQEAEPRRPIGRT